MDKKKFKIFRNNTVRKGYCSDIEEFRELDWEIIDTACEILKLGPVKCNRFLRELTRLTGFDRCDVSWYISEVLTYGLRISGENESILGVGNEPFGKHNMTYFLTEAFKKYNDERKIDRKKTPGGD